jgi:hypothetical protein
MDSGFLRTRYAPCDSYFVESDEISLAERVRERERAMAKVRQREIAVELSNQTSDDYLEDILDHMEHMEVSSSSAVLLHGGVRADPSPTGRNYARCELH